MALSDPRVITLLNRYFVPVYLANVDYSDSGAAPPEEKAELHRIRQDGYAKKLSVGTVHAYAIGPDGHLLDTRHVAQAYKSDILLGMLNGVVEKLGTQPGEPVVRPTSQSAATPAPGELLLHVVARYLQKKGDQYLLINNPGGDWDAIPGEDWIRLSRPEWQKLLPPGPAVKAGDTWEFDRGVAATILTHFYPPTENNEVSRNRIDEQSLKATVESVAGGVARTRLEGGLRMKHTFYYKDDDRMVDAPLVGYLEWETGPRRIKRFRLVTDEAVYRGGGAGSPFGVALRSVP